MKNGDIAVRLDRKIDEDGVLTVTATKDNVDFAIRRNHWVTKGNVPINDAGKSSISFKVCAFKYSVCVRVSCVFI